MSRVVTVVGAGALGSHVVLFLRNQDAAFRVVDHDRVEQKNVLAQFHGKKTVGKSKVQALAQTMQFLFGLRIDGIPHRLRRDNAAPLLGGCDLIIDCLDNLEARAVVSEHARSGGTPCLHGALSPDGQFGRVIWDDSFVPDPEGAPGAATCENGEHLPFIGAVAAHLAHAAQLFLARGEQVGFQVHPGGTTRI